MALVDADVIPEHIEHRITLRDGRTLTAAEWGDPDGLPLISMHGTPGGRIGWWKDPTIDRRFGLRRITFDRAGYGDSTRHRGRSVVDDVADVQQLTDALGIDRFVVAGGSGGGPHVLAAAALLPDRVIRCHAAVSPAPYEAFGDAWFVGMTEGNVIEFSAARMGEAAITELCDELRTMYLDRLMEGRLDWMGDDYDPSDADREQMQQRFIRDRAEVANGLATSADGWIDDNLAMIKPWGFDVESIRVPVLLTYGRTDVFVPAAHGDWLAAHIPNVTAWVDDEGGHFGRADQIERDYGWLTGSAPQ